MRTCTFVHAIHGMLSLGNTSGCDTPENVLALGWIMSRGVSLQSCPYRLGGFNHLGFLCGFLCYDFKLKVTDNNCGIK